MYPLYWTSSKEGIFMRYTYEFKRKCVELYWQGQWPETQEQVLLMINHINNTTRPKLHGATPMKKALKSFDKNAMERIGLTFILPDDVSLKPSLLK